MLCAVLYCVADHVLYSVALVYIVFYCLLFALYCAASYCIILYGVALSHIVFIVLSVFYCIVLYGMVLFIVSCSIDFHCVLSYCTIFNASYCIIRYRIALIDVKFYCIASYCIVLHRIYCLALFYTVFYCVAL